MTALRTASANLQTILPAALIRHTLDLYLADETIIYLSRGAVSRTIDAELKVYSNWIKKLSGFNYSIDAPMDRVNITCQNVDTTLGLYLASDLRNLDYAFGKYSRQYQSIRDESLIEDDVDQFRCVLANAEANEKEIKFELVVDLDAIGDIIAARSLSPRCPWSYQNGIECTSDSVETTCPKHRDACIERHKSVTTAEDRDVEFGGWQFFQNITPTTPGSPGNTTVGQGECFPAGTLVWTSTGFIPIEDIKMGDKVYSWNKITKQIEIKKVWDVFIHPNTANLLNFYFEHLQLYPTPEHNISTAAGLVHADKFEINKTELSIFDTNYIKRTNQKDGWQTSQLERIKNNSDVHITTYNFSVEDFATYFVTNSEDTQFVAAVSNAKYDPNLDDRPYELPGEY